MQITPFPYLGEILSLVTAFMWALSVVLYKKSGENVRPLALNLFKCSFAFILLVPTALLLGVDLFPSLPPRVYIVTILSGLLGIGLADTIFFKSLNMIGAGRTAVVEASYAPYVILLSTAFLGERLNVGQAVGAALIVGAVLVATYTTTERDGALPRKTLVVGVLLGLLASGLMAVGMVLIKPVLGGQSLYWATVWRLVGGLAALGVQFAIQPQRLQVLGSMMVRRSWPFMIAGAFFGQYIALITWLGGMKYTEASIAGALNQTSSIFTFIFAAILLRERVTRRKLVAIGLAVVGVFFITFA
jgi:drug/metabolite transporter (DMT)-like permease